MSFEPRTLLKEVPFLKGAMLRQSAANTLTVTVDRGGSIQLSFFGGLDLGFVGPEEIVAGPAFKVAPLIDLAGMKAAVVAQRAELRDYLDIHAMLTKAGMPLANMVAAAAVIYGAEFSPLLSLKAIAYHDDPTLAGLSAEVRRDLAEAVQGTDVRHLPLLNPIRVRGATP